MSKQAPTFNYLPDGNLHVHIPMVIHRIRGRKRIFPPQAPREENVFLQHSAILQGVARAYAWIELLETGKVKSISSLAKRLEVDVSYVVRLLKLVNLAPDVIEAIIRGEEPEDLSLTSLKKSFPDEWEAQKELFLSPIDQRFKAEKCG